MKYSVLFFATIAALFCTVPISPITATTWHVPGDAATIKAGIGLASAGDTVIVACGIYNENNIRMKSGVVLVSETGQPDCVTIDAQQNHRVILCRSVDNTTRIEGLTITGGFIDGSDDDNGGGVYCLNEAVPSIVNCTVTGNFAGNNGGGVACLWNSSPTFINCIVTNNEADNSGSGMFFHEGASPTLIDCRILDNLGTGVKIAVSSPEFINCTVRGNTAHGVGHWGFARPGVHSTFTDCTIAGNSGSRGAGIFLWGAAATFTNCNVLDNVASSEGGGVYCLGASATLIDCEISNNSASLGGGVYLDDYNFQHTTPSQLTAEYVDFVNNTASVSGPSGFVETGNQLLLKCSVDDLSEFAGSGTIILDNEDCLTPVEETTWGRLKALYH